MRSFLAAGDAEGDARRVQPGRKRERIVVRCIIALGKLEGAIHNHRHVVPLEQIGAQRCIAPADDDAAQAVLGAQCYGLGDLVVVLRVDEEREAGLGFRVSGFGGGEDAAHRVVADIRRQLRVRRLRGDIRLRAGDHLLDDLLRFVHAAALLLLALVHPRRVHRPRHRPVHHESGLIAYRHVRDGPTVQPNDARASRHCSPTWKHARDQFPRRARHRQQRRVRIHRICGPHLGRDAAGLREVAARPHALHLGQPELRAGADQAGIDMLALGVDHPPRRVHAPRIQR